MLLFLDLETTGFDNKKDNILEISAVRYDETKKEIVAKFDRVLNLPEGVEVSPMIEGLTGISTEMCRQDGILMSQAQEEFFAFIEDDDIITGHNISFDTGFLNQFGFLNASTYRHKEIDTFILSVLVLGQEEESHALEILSEKYGIVHENAHRAMSDVLANLEFYLVLEKIYARKFSENFQNFLETHNLDFEEKYFFDQVQKNKNSLEKEALPEISVPEKKDILVDQDASQSEFFVDTFADQKLVFFESFGARKYVQSLLQSAQNAGKKIALFYPNKQKEEFYELFLALQKEFSDLEFFADPTSLICPNKYAEFLSKDSFDKNESIVATKIFRGKELGQELFVRFMGDEWKPARTLQGASRPSLSLSTMTILPASEARVHSNSDEIRVFFGGENIEEDLLNMQQNKLFSKRMLEDFDGQESVDRKKSISAIVSNLSTALRKEKGENQYAVRFNWKDLARLDCKTEVQEAFENFLETDFVACSELQKSHVLEWISFFDEPKENEIKILELYPDNKLSICTIDPFFEDSFAQMCSSNESTLFFGKSFPQNFQEKISLSFPLPSQSGHHTDQRFVSPEVFCPDFSRDATPQEIAKVVIENLQSENPDNFVISLTSKKNIGEVKDLLREISEEKGIKIFSPDNGGRGKIKKMMEKFPQKIVIGNTKFLAGLDLNPEDFSALFVHKVQFDHPKQPLIQAQRKRFYNDFEEYSTPRAIGRLIQDVFQFSETPAGEKIKIYLGEGRIYDSSTFYSKFQKIFPEGTVFKSWNEAL